MRRHAFLDRLDALDLVRPYGLVRTVNRGQIEASGPACAIGDLCEIDADGGVVLAEAVAIRDTRLILVPLDAAHPVPPGAKVAVLHGNGSVPVGDAFAGRAVNALGNPIDDGPPILTRARVRLDGTPVPALSRIAPRRMLTTGLKAIDGLLTLGVGQRIGIFAASGVGKTSLIEQLIAQVDCDRCVICLVGERGREVETVWRGVVARDDAQRYTLVAATSDETAPLRARSVGQALCLAEFWRAQGDHVLLVVDSVTRLAMALREIGLEAGEPPTVRAYTPNVFAALPRVVERCGALAAGGAVTSVMTVLSETDDSDDPIAETMKSLLDGHIVLSRTLSERGHFPAIDVSRSISRLASSLVSKEHRAVAHAAVALLGTYNESRMLIESGVYASGTRPDIDQAIGCRAALMAFFQQRQDEHVPVTQTIAALGAAVRMEGHHG